MKIENELIIACKTLEAEIEHVSAEEGIEREVIWMESQLHNELTKLHSELQAVLDEVDPRIDRVILGYGNCGDEVEGLAAHDFELIIPKLDDCISLLIGTQSKRQKVNDEYHCYYQTRGWFEPGHNIVEHYQAQVDAYGEEMADYIYDAMYAHYEHMAFLDTGLYSIDELKELTCDICEKFGMKQVVLPATLEYVRAMITGPWPEDQFVRIPPNCKVPTGAFADYL